MNELIRGRLADQRLELASERAKHDERGRFAAPQATTRPADRRTAAPAALLRTWYRP
jgi:hypothetical protein